METIRTDIIDAMRFNARIEELGLGWVSDSGKVIGMRRDSAPVSLPPFELPL